MNIAISTTAQNMILRANHYMIKYLLTYQKHAKKVDVVGKRMERILLIMMNADLVEKVHGL